jgi:hypothetical protein
LACLSHHSDAERFMRKETGTVGSSSFGLAINVTFTTTRAPTASIRNELGLPTYKALYSAADRDHMLFIATALTGLALLLSKNERLMEAYQPLPAPPPSASRDGDDSLAS